jgi:hypothetical protein
MVKFSMLLLAFVALTISVAHASDSCKILFNKQVIFKGEVDNESSVSALKVKAFKKSDCITIVYNSETTNKGWERTFYINGPDEKNIKTITTSKQSGSLSVKASVLNEMKEKRQPVFIYTISLPTDKTLAARIRVRRLFICRIEWK